MNGDEILKDLFERAKSIAVIGIKTAESEDAYRVPLYLQKAGYRIHPVNPKHEEVLGERCVPTISEIDAGPGGVDIINLFRASEHLPGHVDEILALPWRPLAVWMQLGIHHGPSAQRLREVGIEVIQDRCIMVDHRRITGA